MTGLGGCSPAADLFLPAACIYFSDFNRLPQNCIYRKEKQCPAAGLFQPGRAVFLLRILKRNPVAFVFRHAVLGRCAAVSLYS